MGFSYTIDAGGGGVTTVRLSLVAQTNDGSLPADTPQIGNGAVSTHPIPEEIDKHLLHLTLDGHSPGTVYGRRRCLTRLAAELPVPILQAAPDDLLAWRASLQHLSAGTIYNYCTHVREFYRWATLRGLIRESPADGMPVPRRPQRIPRPISEADLMEVVAAAPRRIRLWLVLAAWCGLRACEIAGLKGENILLAERGIIIAADATKGNRERFIPLCDFALAEIISARLAPRGYVFGRRDGRPGPNEPWMVSKLANRLLGDCGVPATLHQLRHRFGTQAYKAKRDLRAVQELMGHKSPATTALYTLSDRPSQVAVVQALPVPRRLRATG